MKKTEEELWKEINENVNTLEYCILLLYKQQTIDEKGSYSTNHQNNKGFNAADAKFFSITVDYIQQEKPLPDWRIVKATIRIRKYLKQLTKLYNERN